MNERWSCSICKETSTNEAGIHLHEVRMHGKPQRTGIGGVHPSSWDGTRERLPTQEEWQAIWETVDRYRRDRMFPPG
jgi:hypothetical protein